jgi:hypothetical protein
LHGSKRNEVLTLDAVQQYGIDSFADPDYVSLCGMTPTEWYAHSLAGENRRGIGKNCLEDKASLSLIPLVCRSNAVFGITGSLPN